MRIKRSAVATTSLMKRIRSIRLVVFDFDGVFTDNHVYILQGGSEAVRCHRGDGLGLRKLEKLGIGTLVLSSETNSVISQRCEKLKIRCIQGREDKRSTLANFAHSEELTLDQVAFVGNDINDLGCLTSVGLPIVVRDAHPDVIRYAKHRTHALGGQGAVREVCDLFERVLARKKV